MSSTKRSRGCLIRRHGGVSVVMYYDDPGVYFFGNGDPCSEARAGQAGFNTAELAKERTLMAKRTAFEKTLSTGATAAFDRTGIKVIAGEAKGKYRLVDTAGVAITDDLTKTAAATTYKAITGQDIDLSTVGEPTGEAEDELV